MRVKTVLKRVLGLCGAVVMSAWELQEQVEGKRPVLVVRVRTKVGHRGRCGRCGAASPCFARR